MPAERPQIPRFVANAYRWADRVILEHDFRNFMSLVTADSYRPLHELLSPDAWQMLRSGWPIRPDFPDLDSVPLWAALMMGTSCFLSPAPGVEPYLMSRCEKDRKPIAFLEALTDFVRHITALPETILCSGVEEAMANIPRGQKEFEATYKAWITFDGDAATCLLQIWQARAPSIHEAIFQKRNQAWAHSLRELVSCSANTLVAVGAGHLFGPGNLFECAGISPELIKAV